VWVPVPNNLDLVEAAALPMAVETATRSLDLLGLAGGQTIFINGGGTMTGFAAVQIALLRGAHVIASAGDTFAGRLCALGAKVTPYGDGMAERVFEIAGAAADFALHAAQVTGTLPDLIRIVGGDPHRVISVSDFDQDGLGVRTTGREIGIVSRYDVLGHYAVLAAAGKFTIPIGRIFALEDWRAALALSQNKRAHGKLVLLLDRAA